MLETVSDYMTLLLGYASMSQLASPAGSVMYGDGEDAESSSFASRCNAPLVPISSCAYQEGGERAADERENRENKVNKALHIMRRQSLMRRAFDKLLCVACCGCKRCGSLRTAWSELYQLLAIFGKAVNLQATV